MDFPCKSQILFLISLHFLLLNSMIRASIKSSKIYNLTKSCKSFNENSEQTKLTINLTGAFIKSHSGYLLNSVDNEGYPENFFCEIVAQASADHIIMLSIESFNIPSQNSLCDENYLYVFDYRSSRSKAMTSAGGEKGLCGRNFPKYPIFTTGPFITIVFKSNLRDFIIPNDAGFQLTLTQVQQADKNNACKSGHFQCSSINFSTTPNEEETFNGAAAFRKRDESVKKINDSPATMARQIIPSRSITTTIYFYCIPFDVICDGVRNCHDGSDEDSNARKLCIDVTSKSIINRFLSIGLSASIAIAVSCTIAITLCIGISVCYCIKLCTSRFEPRQSQFTKGVSTKSDYQPSNNYPINLPVNNMDTYCSSYMPSQSSQFVCIKDVSSPSSSNEQDKIYCVYQEPQFHGYANMSALGRPASEKICHWTSSSLASYPSTSEGHHSHPETPYFKRETTFGDQSPHRNENKCRSSNSRAHTSSYSHHTPTSSRSAKSTRSTKSSHVEKKPLKKNNATQKNHKQFEKFRKYPTDNNRIIVLGPVLGEV